MVPDDQLRPGGVPAYQVGLKAYLLWESNGKPDGGDFSGQARAELEAELRRGVSLEELERRLKTVRRGLRLSITVARACRMVCRVCTSGAV